MPGGADTWDMTGPTLAAALIVRDEQEQLPGCLESLAGVVDEVVVFDTGSVDATVRIAREAGARVTSGPWADDFAGARNEALARTGARWVLSLDADERLRADAPALRALLDRATATDVITVRVRNEAPPALGGSYISPAPRLLHRERVHWVGRVHERPQRTDGGPLRLGSCPGGTAELDHLGYTDPALRERKSARNADLGRAELRQLLAARPRDDRRVAQVLLDLGRSLVGCGQRQEAVEAFETLRELAPDSPAAAQGTDALAGLLLADGQDEVVLVLAEQLRSAGVDPRYCDWLRAQALAQLGQAAAALDLLRTVDAVVDATGRERDLGQVLEVRALAAQLVGARAEARECLLEAMLGYGRVRGRGELLTQLQADRPAADLLAAVRDYPADRRRALIDELAAAPVPGPQLASALAAG
ncbi:MAG: glycosyltransferase family 2 protein [Kineosporiaceae bacterium]